MVKSYDSYLLECNGGHIAQTKYWAKYLMERMGFVKRWSNTKPKFFVSDFNSLKVQFIFDVKAIIQMEEIPSHLVINWDQTAWYSLCSSFKLDNGRGRFKVSRDCRH